MAIQLHGLEAKQGETAFAFLVLRLVQPADRAGLVAVIRHLAAMIPDAEGFVAGLPEELDETMRLVGMPWLPPEVGPAVELQRQLIETAATKGVEAAWFFQTGTALPSIGGDDEDDEDDEDDDADDPSDQTQVAVADDGWEVEEVWSKPENAVESRGAKSDAGEDADDEDDEDDEDLAELSGGDDDDDEDDDDDDDDDDAEWSHGPPPQIAKVRFPVDGYPAILEELDWEDFGIAFKLAGPFEPGESTVLLGFHALWLSPYGGRYRNAAVTVDRKHHAAHLWVDRFAVPSSAEEQVHHLLWVLAKLDEVTPVLHARFAGATMAQKYSGLMGETREPFVLGGNPLIAVHARGGDPAVDAWLATQREWSNEEVAQMLRELAIELVTETNPSDDDDDEDDLEAAKLAVGQDEDEDEDEDEDDDDEDEDEVSDDNNADADAGRDITSHAGAVLLARARAGALDRHVTAAALRPVLAASGDVQRRRDVIDILGALRDRASVPALIRILEQTTIENGFDSIGKGGLVARTARALGEIGDPSAVPALSRVVAAPGDHNDEARPIAAEALATCLASAPLPRHVDEGVFGALLEVIGVRGDAALNAEAHFAYGRLAQQLASARGLAARGRLEATQSAHGNDVTAALARHAALALASVPPNTPTSAQLRSLLHAGLTSLGYDHDYTIRSIRVALGVAEALPELVDPEDLRWLTRFSEVDVRERAHAILVRLGKALSPAAVFDRRAAAALDDEALVRSLAAPHVVGHAVLIVEAGKRGLAAARGAILDLVEGAIRRARDGDAHLLEPDTAILDAAIPILRAGKLDDATIALFDRMLRHSNPHVKWALLEKEPPDDERLLGGMFHVLSQNRSWQANAARQWLAKFEGSDAYEQARAHASVATLDDTSGTTSAPTPATSDT